MQKILLPFKIIGSSTLPLNLPNHKQTEFRKTKSSIKLHLQLVFMEKELLYSDQTGLTNVIDHELEQLELLVNDKACMHFF